MEKKFEIGDYVYADDWVYGKIVYLTDKYAEVYFDTLRGGDSQTFPIESLKHEETNKKTFNFGNNE